MKQAVTAKWGNGQTYEIRKARQKKARKTYFRGGAQNFCPKPKTHVFAMNKEAVDNADWECYKQRMVIFLVNRGIFDGANLIDLEKLTNEQLVQLLNKKSILTASERAQSSVAM